LENNDAKDERITTIKCGLVNHIFRKGESEEDREIKRDFLSRVREYVTNTSKLVQRGSLIFNGLIIYSIENNR